MSGPQAELASAPSASSMLRIPTVGERHTLTSNELQSKTVLLNGSELKLTCSETISGPELCASQWSPRSLLMPTRDAATTSQTAMNIAAMIGPITNPLKPNSDMPPNVEINTT